MSLRDVRLRQAIFGIMLGGALAVTGCASTGAVGVQAGPASETRSSEEAGRPSVEYINVVGSGDKVLIGTSGPVKYTAFKLSDPSRLIVDMPGMDLEKVAASVAVDNDFLGVISTAAYGEDKDIGRIVIGLREGVDHEVKSGENSILVSLKKEGGAAAAEEPLLVSAVSEPVIEEPLPDVQGAITAEDTAVQQPPAAVPAKPAKKITGIESGTDGENTVITVFTDGLAGNNTSFVLSRPARLVVDVWGVGNSTGKDASNFQVRHIKGVRIGSYPDKARLVFDAAGEKIPSHSIRAENGAIVITIGPKATQPLSSAPAPQPVKVAEAKAEAVEIVTAPVEEAVPAASAPAPAPAEVVAPAASAPAQAEARPEAVKIEAVDYRKVGGKGRLTITASSKPEYRLTEGKEGKSLAMDIKGAVIPDALVRTLEASRLGTPVSTVSSYQESVSPSSVRVLVRLNEKTAYNVQEDGNSLVVDFVQPAREEVQPAASAEKALTDKGAAPKAKQYTGKKVDLDMMDANISDVLRLLAEISNMNIVASDDVKGTISLRLKNVPWDQAFDIIMESKGLGKIQDGNVIRVAPAQRIRQEHEALLASKKAEEKLEDMDLEFIAVNYASAEDLVKQVKGVLSERGDVQTDKRTNTLIVKDIRKGIEAARNVVTKLDTEVPQVLIEARIVEASSSFARDLGVQWGVDFRTGGNVHSDVFGSTNQFGQAPHNPGTQSATIEDGGAYGSEKKNWPVTAGVTNYAVNLPAAGNIGTLGALGFVFGKLGDPLILDLRLSAGESQGQLKTISRPRITTLDNKEAKIEQGESIPFETTSASGTATTFVDANLSLTVTPHITPDGSVLMTIKASRNSIGTFRTAGGQPSINKKEATTDVLVKDGETTVIGGIVITDKNDGERGIPYLKDIPVLGWLFKSKSISDSQTELLIFITPKIMKEKAVG